MRCKQHNFIPHKQEYSTVLMKSIKNPVLFLTYFLKELLRFTETFRYSTIIGFINYNVHTKMIHGLDVSVFKLF